MIYRINNNQIISDNYQLACSELIFGCIEVYDDGIIIDVIDYETAKLDDLQFKLKEKGVENEV